MTARYAALRDRCVSAVDALWAELVLHRPMLQSARDMSRQEQSITGVLRTGEFEARSVRGDARRGQERVQVAGAVARLALNVADYGSLDIRKGDEIMAGARAGERWFEVLFVDRTGHARIMVYLGES